MQNVTVCWHAYNARAPQTRGRALALTFRTTSTATLADILREAVETHRASRGTHQTGIYEVQTDAGIYRREDECRIDVSTAARAARVTFRTWDELEREELAA